MTHVWRFEEAPRLGANQHFLRSRWRFVLERDHAVAVMVIAVHGEDLSRTRQVGSVWPLNGFSVASGRARQISRRRSSALPATTNGPRSACRCRSPRGGPRDRAPYIPTS